VKPLLNIEKNIDRTCLVGIFEIGGIDTTTIAKTFYNSIASLTEGSCSLENIRETSDQKVMIHLQNSISNVPILWLFIMHIVHDMRFYL
jgi:hypothetical protein